MTAAATAGAGSTVAAYAVLRLIAAVECVLGIPAGGPAACRTYLQTAQQGGLSAPLHETCLEWLYGLVSTSYGFRACLLLVLWPCAGCLCPCCCAAAADVTLVA